MRYSYKYEFLTRSNVMNTKFSLETIFRIDTLELLSRIVAEGLQTGIQPSRRSGYSDEFHDYRQYSGEESKSIDWKLFARTDKLFLKKYHERVTTDIHIFLDGSASMNFGMPMTKSVFARYMTAILALLAVRQRDTITIHFCNDNDTLLCRSARSRKEILPMCRTFETMNDTGIIDFSLLASYSVSLKNSVVFFISDFWCDEQRAVGMLNDLKAHNNDVYVVHVLSPGELDMSNEGIVRYVDSETGNICVCKTSEIRRFYREEIQSRITLLRESFLQRGIRYIQTQTDEYIPKAVSKVVR